MLLVDAFRDHESGLLIDDHGVDPAVGKVLHGKRAGGVALGRQVGEPVVTEALVARRIHVSGRAVLSAHDEALILRLEHRDDVVGVLAVGEKRVVLTGDKM